MPRKKLQRFSQLKTFANVAQTGQADTKSKLKKFLGDSPEIILELGCGKGEYAIALSQKYKDKKIVGIDIQGERLWYGAKISLENNLKNVFWLREQIENLDKYFSKNSIAEIWISFPDPQPKKRQIKKRLTNQKFLKIYKNLIKNKGVLNLKTDDKKFFDYSRQNVLNFGGKIIKEIPDIYQKAKLAELLKIQTTYEKKNLKNGKKIYYLAWQLKY